MALLQENQIRIYSEPQYKGKYIDIHYEKLMSLKENLCQLKSWLNPFSLKKHSKLKLLFWSNRADYYYILSENNDLPEFPPKGTFVQCIDAITENQAFIFNKERNRNAIYERPDSIKIYTKLTIDTGNNKASLQRNKTPEEAKLVELKEPQIVFSYVVGHNTYLKLRSQGGKEGAVYGESLYPLPYTVTHYQILQLKNHSNPIENKNEDCVNLFPFSYIDKVEEVQILDRDTRDRRSRDIQNAKARSTEATQAKHMTICRQFDYILTDEDKEDLISNKIYLKNMQSIKAEIKSITVGKNFSIILFEEAYYTGRAIHVTENLPIVNQVTVTPFNSIYILEPGCVIIFKDTLFRGLWKKVCHSTQCLNKSFGDESKIESIAISPNTVVELYTGDNFNETKAELRESVGDLRLFSLYKVRSIKFTQKERERETFEYNFCKGGEETIKEFIVLNQEKGFFGIFGSGSIFLEHNRLFSVKDSPVIRGVEIKNRSKVLIRGVKKSVKEVKNEEVQTQIIARSRSISGPNLKILKLFIVKPNCIVLFIENYYKGDHITLCKGVRNLNKTAGLKYYKSIILGNNTSAALFNAQDFKNKQGKESYVIQYDMPMLDLDFTVVSIDIFNEYSKQILEGFNSGKWLVNLAVGFVTGILDDTAPNEDANEDDVVSLSDKEQFEKCFIESNKDIDLDDEDEVEVEEEEEEEELDSSVGEEEEEVDDGGDEEEEEEEEEEEGEGEIEDIFIEIGNRRKSKRDGNRVKKERNKDYGHGQGKNREGNDIQNESTETETQSDTDSKIGFFKKKTSTGVSFGQVTSFSISTEKNDAIFNSNKSFLTKLLTVACDYRAYLLSLNWSSIIDTVTGGNSSDKLSVLSKKEKKKKKQRSKKKVKKNRNRSSSKAKRNIKLRQDIDQNSTSIDSMLSNNSHNRMKRARDSEYRDAPSKTIEAVTRNGEPKKHGNNIDEAVTPARRKYRMMLSSRRGWFKSIVTTAVSWVYEAVKKFVLKFIMKPIMANIDKFKDAIVKIADFYTGGLVSRLIESKHCIEIIADTAIEKVKRIITNIRVIWRGINTVSSRVGVLILLDALVAQLCQFELYQEGMKYFKLGKAIQSEAKDENERKIKYYFYGKGIGKMISAFANAETFTEQILESFDGGKKDGKSKEKKVKKPRNRKKVN
eukprot:CAMPEP_0170528406 /NCGR_PEP_ID=MMETSP0209-20121228/13910_1 /TAXON_ID=665100 ORGANISM="Litonotus pictus, Strain P1" /NCGR_SAMPLE_ID=MMETSP0209 /ASSEMBLY_ACC=CAM_ASM_000301 /LENGTH=1163 /DNA_ID=CAMNT_0010819597 /DNA_START=328 /DNA_END=3819 /DNA_ORIENTATION=-